MQVALATAHAKAATKGILSMHCISSVQLRHPRLAAGVMPTHVVVLAVAHQLAKAATNLLTSNPICLLAVFCP
jgi:hypothetical protein